MKEVITDSPGSWISLVFTRGMAVQSGYPLDYLNIGSEVQVTTSLDKDIVGEVLACDGISRMLMLKSHRPQQPPELDDLHLINMDQVKNVVVLKDVPENQTPSDLPEISSVDLQETQIRLRQNLAQRVIKRSSASASGNHPATNTKPN